MRKQLGVIITDLLDRPSRGSVVAASLRQLLRAHDAEDRIAIWLATSSCCMSFRLWIRDLLPHEPSWDSKRWLDGFGNRIVYDEPDRFLVADAMCWGLRSDSGNRLRADPFDIDIKLTEDRSDLASYTVRYGDLRDFPEEDLQSSRSRIERELDAGMIEWAYVFRHEASGVEVATPEV